MKPNKKSYPLLALLILPVSAEAHVTLAQKEAKIGADYVAVFQVGHGCAGKPTEAIRVRLPAGVVTAEPLPAPGWKAQVINGPIDRPFQDKGAAVTYGATEIAWKGGKIGDGEKKEFSVKLIFADSLLANRVLYFPVVQECVGAVDRWIEIPAPGKSSEDYKFPAPSIVLTAP